MDSKLVSVIIPAFNAEKYIYQCVMSVLCQTYTNIEVIVVNDGSNDATWKILNQIIDTRLVLINQENNGCSSAKNSGLRISKGDFIQYLDSDDMLSPDKLKNQVLALFNNEDAIAVCKTCVFQTELDEVVGEIDTELIRKEGTGFEFLLRLLGSEGFSAMVQPNAYLISRKIADLIGEWNVILSPSPDEDGEYFARALCIAEKVIFTEGVNYYRKLPLQTSLSNLYSFQRVTNLLATIECKFQHVFLIEKSIRTLKLYKFNVTQIVYQFGFNFPQIISLAEKNIVMNGISDFELSDHKYFNWFLSCFGIRVTLIIFGLYRGLKRLYYPF